jgi:hypothetical protein
MRCRKLPFAPGAAGRGPSRAEKFHAWFSQILVNVCRTRLRQRSKRRTLDVDDVDLESGDPFRASLARDSIGRALSCLSRSCAWSSCSGTGGSCRWPKSPTGCKIPSRHGQIQTSRRPAGAAPPDRTGGRGHPMKDSELDDELDLEMDERLTRFARGTRQPALPDEVGDLPWTVQRPNGRERARSTSSGAGSWLGRPRRSGPSPGRLGADARRGRVVPAAGGPGPDGRQRSQSVAARAHATPVGRPAAPGGPKSSWCRRAASSTTSWPITSPARSAEPRSDGAAAVIIQLDTLGGSSKRRCSASSSRSIEGPDDRLGRPERSQGGERRHVHHPRREPGLHGAPARTSERPHRSPPAAPTSPRPTARPRPTRYARRDQVRSRASPRIAIRRPWPGP